MITPLTTSGSSASSTALSRAADRYEFAALSQHGRTGSTYQARDRMDQRTVAIKLLPFNLREPKAKRTFESRAKALCRVSHPNLVPVTDYGYHYGLAYLVSNEPGGVNLGHYLRTRGPLPWKQFAVVFDGLLEALKAAHEHNLVHGDVQPSHVILFDDGQWVTDLALTGFGLPDLANNVEVSMADDTRHMSMIDAIAPEQLFRQACDHRLDLYSLGATAYEMLSGVDPFAGTSVGRVFKAVYEPPTPLRELLPADHGVPDSVLELIAHLLEKSPDDRPPDADQASFWFRSAAQLESYEISAGRIPALTKAERVSPETVRDIAAARPVATAADSQPSIQTPQPASSKGASSQDTRGSSERTRLLSRSSIPTFVAPAAEKQSLSPRQLLQFSGIVLLFLIFTFAGWVMVMNGYVPGVPVTSPAAVEETQQKAPVEVAEPTENDTIHALFTRIDSALDEQRYGTAESLIERLEEREDFPRELNGTLRAYRSRLDLYSDLNRARRWERHGKPEDALVLYGELAERYPNHPEITRSVPHYDRAFVLHVKSNIRGIVSVDDEPVGITPLTALVPIETSRVSVWRKGYETWQTSVAAQEGTKLELDVTLDRRKRGKRPTQREMNLEASPFMDLMEMKLE